MTNLARTTFLLNKPVGYTKGNDAGQVFFDYPGDDGEAPPRHEFQMDAAVWADMGSPTTITVTIVPGDALNEGDDD